MIGLYVNNSSREHFGAALLNGEKTVETRSRTSFERFIRSGVKYGDRIGIIFDGYVQGTAIFKDYYHYIDKESFDSDAPLHLVKEGSPYYWKEEGKYGLLFSDPAWLEKKVKVKCTGNRTYAIIQEEI